MNNKQLKQEIEEELKEIKICRQEIELDNAILIEKRNTPECRRLTLAVGLNLHGLYTGTERIFENISKTIDSRPIGKTASWHSDLLKRMCEEIPKVRKLVIGKSSFSLLNELRGFRHVVRSHYGNKLDTQKVLDLAAKIPNGYQILEKELKQFIAELPEEITSKENQNSQSIPNTKNRELYQKYQEQFARDTNKNNGYFANILQEQQDVKIARLILSEFPAEDPKAVIKIRQIISQSERSLYLKQTKDKIEVNQYLNTIINKSLKSFPDHKSRNKSSELNR